MPWIRIQDNLFNSDDIIHVKKDNISDARYGGFQEAITIRLRGVEKEIVVPFVYGHCLSSYESVMKTLMEPPEAKQQPPPPSYNFNAK